MTEEPFLESSEAFLLAEVTSKPSLFAKTATPPNPELSLLAEMIQ